LINQAEVNTVFNEPNIYYKIVFEQQIKRTLGITELY